MDAARFDAISRRVADGISRRAALRAIVGAIVAGVLGPGRAAAAGCRPPKAVCTSNRNCCSHRCGPKDKTGRRRCQECASGIICGTVCCPANALNACSEITGPDGPVIHCTCPCETTYHVATNTCDPIDACRNDRDCCSGTCCDGVCCAAGNTVCCAGHCAVDALACSCPSGTSCGPTLTCSGFGRTYTTGDLCCPWPQASFCCTDSYPGVHDGTAGCCTFGVDCPFDNGVCADAVATISSNSYTCCDDDNPDPQCGKNGDCCFNDITADPHTIHGNCIKEGDPCHPDYLCCFGSCRSGVCACVGDGAVCNIDDDCCQGQCFQDKCRSA